MKSKINILIVILLLITGSFACGISAPKYTKGSAKDINLTLDEMKAVDFATNNLNVAADGLWKQTLFNWVIVHVENCDNLETFSYRYFYPVYFLGFRGEGTGVTVTVYKDSDSAQSCFDKIKSTLTQTNLYDFIENPIDGSDDSVTAFYQDYEIYSIYYLKGNVIGRVLTSCDTCAVTIAEKVIEKISNP
jgi:hypothetical protein